MQFKVELPRCFSAWSEWEKPIKMGAIRLTKRKAMVSHSISTKHAAIAFALAPLLPSAIVAWSEPSSSPRVLFFVIVALLSYVPTLVFGIPLFVLLRRRVQPSLAFVSGIGSLIAVLPLNILGLCTGSWGAPESVTQLGIVRAFTDWSTLPAAPSLALLVMVLGALGGLVFWVVTMSSLSEPYTTSEGQPHFPYA